MFKIIYAKSVVKDLKRINRKNLEKIKEEIEELKNFPNISQIKHLTNHPLADYRLRIGNYRVLFNVDWKKKEIHILKIDTEKKCIKFLTICFYGSTTLPAIELGC